MDRKKLLITIFIIFVAGAVGYFVLVRKPTSVTQQTQTPTPIQVPVTQQPTPVPTTLGNETSNWKVYRNEKYGFEFKYPPNWLSDSVSSNILFISHTAQLKEDLTSESRIQMGSPIDLDSLPSASKNQFLSDIKQKSNFTIGGDQAVREVQKDSQTLHAEYIWFLHGQQYFSITLTWGLMGSIQEDNYSNKSDTLKVFDQILSTFKFTQL